MKKSDLKSAVRFRTSRVFFLVVALSACVFSSCGDDMSEESFNFPMSYVYGTWNMTSVYANDKWYDLTVEPYKSRMSASITFKKNGKFSGEGYFGNGEGTYTASGSTIITYIDGEEYMRYIVEEATNDSMSGAMRQGSDGTTMRFKAAKE